MPLEQRRIQVNDISPPDAGEKRREPLRWYGRMARLLAVVFCAGVGALLLVLPWGSYWEQNYFSDLGAGWYAMWMNSYFRGAVSGLGVVNLYIFLMELRRLRRTARQ